MNSIKKLKSFVCQSRRALLPLLLPWIVLACAQNKDANHGESGGEDQGAGVTALDVDSVEGSLDSSAPADLDTVPDWPPFDPSADEYLGLPVLSIYTEPARFTELTENATTELTIPATARFDGRSYPDASLEIHGGFARTVAKKSFQLNLEDDDNLLWISQFNPLLPPETHDSIVLHASWIDATFLRNKLTMDAVRAQGGLSPRLTHVFVSINDQPQGLYILCERINARYLKRHRFDLTGTLYKATNHNAHWGYHRDPLAGFERKINEQTPPDDLATLRRLLTNIPANQEDFEEFITPILNLDAFMTWQRTHTFAQDVDTFTKNYYLYHDLAAPDHSPDNQFQLISWDADASWGLNWDGQDLHPFFNIDLHGSDRFSPRLLSIEHYRLMYLTRYQEALQGALHADTLLDQIAATASHIQDAARYDLELWPRNHKDFDTEIERLQNTVISRHLLLQALVADALNALNNSNNP